MDYIYLICDWFFAGFGFALGVVAAGCVTVLGLAGLGLLASKLPRRG